MYEVDGCVAVFGVEKRSDGAYAVLRFFGMEVNMMDPRVYNGMGMFSGAVNHQGDAHQNDSPNSVRVDDPDLDIFIRDKTEYACSKAAQIIVQEYPLPVLDRTVLDGF